MPQFSFLQFLCLRRSRSPKPPEENSSQATGVHASSRPSSVHGPLQQGQGGPVTAAPNISNDSAGQSDPDSQLMSSLVVPNSAQTPAPSGSVPPINVVPPSLTTDSDPSQHKNLLVVPGRSPATASQTSLLSQQSSDGNSGTIYIQKTHESRNVSVQGDGNNVNYSNTVNNHPNNRFMEKLLGKTIPGAAFDSSDRDPPPRCHPETRLVILARCLEFIVNAIGTKKMLWVVGKAGVGKSAIMQSVADNYFSPETPQPGASIFFSVNGRNNGAKAIMTLAYQLAESCEPYRQFIEDEITRKPSLLQSSLSVQFKKLIIKPYILQPPLNPVGPVLIIVDGLDECDKSHTQRELLRLISDSCSTYPSSPVVWVIASRPEPHITSFFAQDHVKAVYEKEEILVDTDQARSDVETCLRDELASIRKEFSLNPQSQWPREQDLWKLANASGGLFVFADTVIKYIGDRASGNPTSQLSDVLKVVDADPLLDIPQEEHPMARLDALYAQILAKTPNRVVRNARRILLALIWDSKAKEYLRTKNFIVFCNWLDLTCDDAYAAIRHLSAVLDVPPPVEAHNKMLRPFHKSFIDYISDSNRSGFSSAVEAYQLEVELTFRVLEQAPDGIDFGGGGRGYYIGDGRSVPMVGLLQRGPGTGGNICLAWTVDTGIYWTEWNDNITRLEMYKLAVSNVVEGIRQGESAFCTESCIRLVTSRFKDYGLSEFPSRELLKLVFERSPRNELMDKGMLKQIPVQMLDITNTRIASLVRLRFRRPTATTTNVPHQWNPSCKHERTGDWREGKVEDWTTDFTMTGSKKCYFCFRRLEQQREVSQTRSPDHLVTILFTSTGKSFVDFQFVNLDDELSEWTYWFVYKISEEERRNLGNFA